MSTNDPTTLYTFANDTGSSTAVLHLRFRGRSRDIALETLSLTASSTDDDIKHAVAQFVDVAMTEMSQTVVERHANGNLTLRPEAVFG